MSASTPPWASGRESSPHFAAAGWHIPDSEANFVWLATGRHTESAAAACAEGGVVVRPFSGEGLRVTIGEPEANDIFLKVAADLRSAVDA